MDKAIKSATSPLVRDTLTSLIADCIKNRYGGFVIQNSAKVDEAIYESFDGRPVKRVNLPHGIVRPLIERLRIMGSIWDRRYSFHEQGSFALRLPSASGDHPAQLHFLVATLTSQGSEKALLRHYAEEPGAYKRTISDLFPPADILHHFLSQARAQLRRRHAEVAAQLAGVALELTLRALCRRAGAPGEGSLNTLNRVLIQRGIYPPETGTDIDRWRKIRNAAAHGSIGQFEPASVPGMIRGVERLASEHRLVPASQ